MKAETAPSFLNDFASNFRQVAWPERCKIIAALPLTVIGLSALCAAAWLAGVTEADEQYS